MCWATRPHFGCTYEKHIAKLMDSANLPDGEAVFTVTTEGVKD
jgi:hypothetical protein